MTKEQRDALVLNTSGGNATQLLASDVRAARKRLHMTFAVMASQIGISESALRRIENGTSHATRVDTLRAIVAWAARRGYREFGGVTLAPVPDTPESDAKAARAFGERFEALGRSE